MATSYQYHSKAEERKKLAGEIFVSVHFMCAWVFSLGLGLDGTGDPGE